jgi:hypothetical protein
MESTQKENEQKLKEILVNVHNKGNNLKDINVEELINEIKEELVSLMK